MIFSQETASAAQKGFEALLGRAGGAKKREVLSRLAAEAGDVLTAAEWLYANSPLSDLADYDCAVFLSAASHGVFLREHSPYAGDVPEDIFLNYVLHTRVNEEELCDCRKFFYGLLSPRVKGLGMMEAIIEANYWCAEQVAYQSTDSRTISALGAYRSAYGRCGEESVFAVNVFRSLGIPARQVYTPRWSHCDDNHAWVEVWCGGEWHFLGACEPEEALDRGWFTNAAGRAMLVHSRCFGEISGEEVIAKSGMATFLNHTGRYAAVKRLTVAVKDASGAAVEGARVSFGILNGSSIFPAAVVKTGRDGTASLTCGLGSIHIHVQKGGIFCGRMVYTPDADAVEIVLEQEALAFDTWKDFVFSAPRDRAAGGAQPTPPQKALGRQKTAAANGRRKRRVEAMFHPARVRGVMEKYGYSQEIYTILAESRGNLERLLDFLSDERFAAGDKEALLPALSAKDWRDIDPDILREALSLSRGYAVGKPELFYPYVVCPRASTEPLSMNRQFILDYFSEGQKAIFRENPAKIWAYIQETIRFDPSVEYSQIVTRPVAALTVKNASPLSRKILFVSICRALGVPARMDPVDLQAEYFADGQFLPVEGPREAKGALVFEKGAGEAWQYGADFGIARLADGGYEALDLSREAWDGSHMAVPLAAGVYRVITSNRLPNGNIYASGYRLRLNAGETKTLALRKFQADLPEMLGNYVLDDFQVFDGEGRPVSGRALTRGKAVLLWLEEGKEPTEHMLNEMLEREAEFKQLPAHIVFLVRGKEALQNDTLQKVLGTFPQIRVCFDPEASNVEPLARRMYVDPEKLPLVLVASRELNAVYACSGYNVGGGEMVVKICRSV